MSEMEQALQALGQTVQQAYEQTIRQLETTEQQALVKALQALGQAVQQMEQEMQAVSGE